MSDYAQATVAEVAASKRVEAMRSAGPRGRSGAARFQYILHPQWADKQGKLEADPDADGRALGAGSDRHKAA